MHSVTEASGCRRRCSLARHLAGIAEDRVSSRNSWTEPGNYGWPGHHRSPAADREDDVGEAKLHCGEPAVLGMAPEALDRDSIYAGLATVAGFALAVWLTFME